MLIPKRVVEEAMSLSVVDVRCALVKSGYGGSDVKSATFLGLGSVGEFIYEIKYVSHEGHTDSGRVYLRPEFNEKINSFAFNADF
jgi:hypothetical protein